MKANYLLLLFFLSANSENPDLTVVAPANIADGVGQLSVFLIDALKEDLTINFVSSRGKYSVNLNDINPQVKAILEKNTLKQPGTISLMLDGIWYQNIPTHKNVPHSKINIALSMIETDRLPNEWVNILNSKFDMVIVPDHFLVEVYTLSGVNKPIFVLPCGMSLKKLNSIPPKKTLGGPFIFGSSGAIWPRKNQKLLIRAFAEEFGNNNDVQLILHSRFGNQQIENEIKDILKEYNLSNVILLNESLNRKKYIDFMRSLDCYILISKGEGFSLSVREAMALGIPAIVSCNSAHKTLCNSTYVLGVPSNILEKADYSVFFGEAYNANYWNCSIQDVRNAMREMVNNYSLYHQKAKEAKKWVQKYDYENLKEYYLSLIKPKWIIAGNKNIINKEFIMINDLALYGKYVSAFPFANTLNLTSS